MKSKADIYIEEGNYNLAVFEILKECGILTFPKKERQRLKRPDKFIF